MKCPHCTKEIHFEATQSHNYENDPDSDSDMSGFSIGHGFCPSCNELIVLVQEGIFDDDTGEFKVQDESIVYPKIIAVKKFS